MEVNVTGEGVILHLHLHKLERDANSLVVDGTADTAVVAVAVLMMVAAVVVDNNV